MEETAVRGARGGGQFQCKGFVAKHTCASGDSRAVCLIGVVGMILRGGLPPSQSRTKEKGKNWGRSKTERHGKYEWLFLRREEKEISEISDCMASSAS